MEFVTGYFEMAHGKAPRGYGQWAFCPHADFNRENYLDSVMWHTGTYAEAKKRARAYFGARGVETVAVCP